MAEYNGYCSACPIFLMPRVAPSFLIQMKGAAAWQLICTAVKIRYQLVAYACFVRRTRHLFLLSSNSPSQSLLCRATSPRDKWRGRSGSSAVAQHFPRVALEVSTLVEQGESVRITTSLVALTDLSLPRPSSQASGQLARCALDHENAYGQATQTSARRDHISYMLGSLH